MGPIDVALKENKRWLPMKGNAALCEALTNFGSLIRLMGRHPTHCRELIVDQPGYISYCNASTLATGGVWLSGTLHLAPIVWCLEWPEDIRQQVVSFANPGGTITNSDLKMAAMLVHYLVLEHLIDLRHVHVAAWYDNTPTVSW
jgi:hypothetical protein